MGWLDCWNQKRKLISKSSGVWSERMRKLQFGENERITARENEELWLSAASQGHTVRFTIQIPVQCRLPQNTMRFESPPIFHRFVQYRIKAKGLSIYTFWRYFMLFVVPSNQNCHKKGKDPRPLPNICAVTFPMSCSTSFMRFLGGYLLMWGALPQLAWLCQICQKILA